MMRVEKGYASLQQSHHHYRDNHYPTVSAHIRLTWHASPTSSSSINTRTVLHTDGHPAAFPFILQSSFPENVPFHNCNLY